MALVEVKDLYRNLDDYTDKDVTLEGWVKTVRGSKKVGFIEINDGSFLKNAQIVIEKSKIDNFDEMSKLPISSTIRVTGQLVATPKAQQPFEIHPDKAELIGHSNPDYPLQKKEQSYEFLRTKADLRPRTRTFYSVFKIRSIAAAAIHQYFQSHDYVYVNTPIITSSDAEGAGQMFRATTFDLNNLPKKADGKVDDSKDFFKEETNLTVSGQLQEEAFALAFRNTYTFGPTFRAENSHTARHASEFWMVEPEMAFMDLNGLIATAEDFMKSIVKYIMKHAPEEIQFLNDNVDSHLIERLELTEKEKFARLTYTEAIKELQDSGHKFEIPVTWGMDLKAEHERYLCEQIYKKPVFLTDYPRDIKAFYMRDNDDGKTVAAVDMLVPEIGEMIGGSQREEREKQLDDKIKEFGLNPASYKWYSDLRRYGETKHSGFGLGFERLVMYVTGMDNIRDVIPYPRTPGNAPF